MHFLSPGLSGPDVFASACTNTSWIMSDLICAHAKHPQMPALLCTVHCPRAGGPQVQYENFEGKRAQDVQLQDALLSDTCFSWLPCHETCSSASWPRVLLARCVCVLSYPVRKGFVFIKFSIFSCRGVWHSCPDHMQRSCGHEWEFPVLYLHWYGCHDFCCLAAIWMLSQKPSESVTKPCRPSFFRIIRKNAFSAVVASDRHRVEHQTRISAKISVLQLCACLHVLFVFMGEFYCRYTYVIVSACLPVDLSRSWKYATFLMCSSRSHMFWIVSFCNTWNSHKFTA